MMWGNYKAKVRNSGHTWGERRRYMFTPGGGGGDTLRMGLKGLKYVGGTLVGAGGIIEGVNLVGEMMGKGRVGTELGKDILKKLGLYDYKRDGELKSNVIRDVLLEENRKLRSENIKVNSENSKLVNQNSKLVKQVAEM